MDPSTTLITFTFETEPSVKSVQLIGSWDNFSTWYPMKQDTRRGRGQWRGCPAFKSISRGNASRPVQPSRNPGGLKMGRTYYYYYEINGSTETHDPTRPSTTACPYLPGQTVNTIYIPVERTLRSRSASVNSLRQESFMTTDPEARFVPPVPPSTLLPHVHRHLGSVSSLLYARSSDRSESGGPPWNLLFGSFVGGAPISERPKTPGCDRDENSSQHNDGALLPDSRPCSSSGEQTSLDIYPESLQRFLLDDAPPLESVAVEGAPSLGEQASRDIHAESLRRVKVDDAPPMDSHAASDLFPLGEQHLRDVYPESLQRFLLDIASPLETVVNGASTPHPPSSQPDQDDYFATPASLDTPAFTTASTPPSQRIVSKGALSHQRANSISLTLITKPDTQNQPPTELLSTHLFAKPELYTTGELAQCTWSPAVSSSTCPASISPQSPLDETMCSDDSDDDDDDMASNLGGDCLSYRSQSDMPTTSEAFQRYSLPRHCAEDKVLPSANHHHHHHHHQMGKLGPEPMLTGTARESSLPVAVTNFLGEPIDTGLDEFVSELGLMAEGIGRGGS
ncbi:hypothetical protein E4U61_004327 [Claviceps capensis]|nr:hypothetical protein E4U61_004327 [Claviceps capensis]